MALSITKSVLTPTLKLWVETSDASALAGFVHYDVTCASGTHTLTPVVSVSNRILVGDLRVGHVYTLTVTADATVDQTATTSINTAAGNVPFVWDVILRQRVCDILLAAGIAHQGRALQVVCDAYGQPRLLDENDLQAKRSPLVEVGLARMTATRQTSQVFRTNVYSLDVLVAAISQAEGAAEICATVAGQVRAALDATRCLTLFGIVDTSWTWAYSKPREQNQYVATVLTLQVPVQEIIGALPYAT